MYTDVPYQSSSPLGPYGGAMWYRKPSQRSNFENLAELPPKPVDSSVDGMHQWKSLMCLVCDRLDQLCSDLDASFPRNANGSPTAAVLHLAPDPPPTGKVFAQVEHWMPQSSRTPEDEAQKAQLENQRRLAGHVRLAEVARPPQNSRIKGERRDDRKAEDYSYLLNMSPSAMPDKDNPKEYQCSVPGVYWDKRSWIASWYESGRRCYKSYSAKTHGFYRAKYSAIQVRYAKVRVPNTTWGDVAKFSLKAKSTKKRKNALSG